MMKITDRRFLNSETLTCHASTIAFHKGSLIFSWFGGSREGMPDSSIYVQSKDKIKTIGKNVNVAYWNPILFTVKDELFLAYKVGRFCDSWQTFIVNITDIDNIKDLNKVKKQIIPAGLNFAVKTKPIQYGDLIYCGSSVETREDWTSYIESYKYENGKMVFNDRSVPLTVDKKIHEYTHPVYGKIKTLTQGIIQPSLWVDNIGTLNAFFRSSRGLGRIYCSSNFMSKNNDGWSDPYPTEFKNPNSGMDTVYFNERLFLVHNPSEEFRSPIVISELDSAFNIIDEVVVKDGIDSSDKTFTGELSYPYMVEHDGKLHLTYTYGRSKIEYVTIEV